MAKWKPIYVVAGKEDSLVNAACDELLDQLLEPEERTTGLFKADAAEVSASDVLDELRTAPFLTEKRVTVIKGADDFVSKNRPMLEKYFDKPCPTGVLVLAVSSWPSQTNLAKKLTRVGKLISITSPKPWQLPDRLIKYAKDAYGQNLTKDAAELLIELTGDELTQLYSEIDKLAIFAYTEKAITSRHIELLIGHNRLFNAFAVIDTCLAGNVTQAVERLRSMFAEDKSAEYTVVGAFAFHFRRLFSAKVLLQEGLGPVEVARRLKIWGNKDGFFAQLHKMPLNKLSSTLKQLAEIDFKIKTGQTKAEVAIEQLVMTHLSQ